MRRSVDAREMSSLLDLRPSRLSLTILIALSALATFVILSGGRGRTHAETAALAALHERPATRTVVVAAAPAAPAGRARPNSATPTGDNGSGAGSPASASPSPASADTSDSAATDTSGDTTTTNGSTAANTSTTTTTPSAVSDLPKVGHVFEIALSTTSYKAAFGHGAAPYLHSLERKGTLLRGYHSLGSSELADNLAMISGQAPNPDTRGGCTTYAEFPTAVVAKANGLVPGTGCVYPETALTLGDQVSSSGHIWRAYVEDQGKQACVHANSNAVDDLPLPGADPGYDSRHNPFVYFHSLLDLGDCATDDLDLSRLPAALSSASKTATFSFLAPSACGDARAIAGGTDPTSTDPTTTTTSSSTTPATGTTPSTGTATTPTTAGTTTVSGALGSPTAAACPAGPVGIAAENTFLQRWVPVILRSPAYKKDGVLVIAVSGDGAKRSGPHVRTGALVLSRYTRKGRAIATAYSPYSLLRSLEDMLRYTPLAKAKSAPSFASAALRKTN
jgi:phosphatidylinositol-3-phosphatase